MATSALVARDIATAAEEKLRRIESVTDSTLAQLDADELLVELLERVRETLEADTAAVLLLHQASGQLIATAARGLEDEVRQGFRVPIGQGFAGRIAAEKRPVVLDRVDHSTVRNPVLRQKGIRSLLGVPLLAHGEVLGVLHVGTQSTRTFTEEDAELLQLVGDRVALALLTRRSASERTATLALQRSLVPERLPEVAGIELASRYIAAEAGGVGGDWYDFFELPSGHVCIIVGDVVGRGLQAAIVMGRLRSTVRAYAMDTLDPGALLDKVDRKLQHFEPTEMATALVAVLDPSLQTMQVSLAGHPPLVVATPGEPARDAELPVDPPLGISPHPPRRSGTVDVAPGTVLCFFTDGLVERRREPIDARLAMLRDAVTADEPEAVCQNVMGRLVASDRTTDDIAVLVVRPT